MDNLMTIPANFASDKAGLAAGTTTTLTSANAIDYSIKGKAYAKAISSNEATPTTDAVTGAAFVGVAAGKGSVFTICRDAAGALKVVQGSIVDLDASGNFTTSLPQFGAIPDTLCPYGYIVVKVAAGGATWTFGASNLAGPPANTTFSFVDCFTLPDRPQAS